MKFENNTTTGELHHNIKTLQNLMENSSDLLIREFSLVSIEKRAAILLIEEIVDSNSVQQYILEPLMEQQIPSFQTNKELFAFLCSSVLQVKTVKHIQSMEQAVNELLSGKTIVMVVGVETFLAAETAKWNSRGLSSSKGQRVIKGPHIGFSENRSINISLLRKIIKNVNLRVITKQYGTNTSTDISVVYIENIVDKQILQEIHTRLEKIQLDIVLESNYIEEALTKESKSIFPLMLNTDRPDVTAAEILEGKIAIIVDGSPYVLIAPAVYIQFFQTPEDYYFIERSRWLYRFFRIFLFILATYIPGLYVAFTTYHTNLLPTKLLIGFVSQREMVPIPTILEVIILILIIGELLLKDLPVCRKQSPLPLLYLRRLCSVSPL
ncbi:spore germination protein [Bacillus thuringiensis]